MTKPVEDINIKEISEKMHSCYLDIDQVMVLLFRSFINHNRSFLGEGVALIKDCEEKLDWITDKIKVVSKSIDAGSSNITPLTPDCTKKILSSLKVLVKAIDKKINESILFSEKAVNELRELHAGVRGLVKDFADVILTDNRNFANLLSEQANKMIGRADTFLAGHEERVIKCICSPQSGPIYLDMLDSYKNIARSIKRAC